MNSWLLLAMAFFGAYGVLALISDFLEIGRGFWRRRGGRR